VWVLPLPEGAVADGFTMTINGVPTAGDVLDANEARGVYEGIVRSRRDPGLLEFFGRGCLRARIFPIPARGEVKVDVGYRQVLPERLGLREWSFPLAAAGVGGMAPEKLVLDLTLTSKRPIKNAWSPLPTLQVVQKSDHEVRASFEGGPENLGGKELALYHSLSEKEFGLDLLAHRRAGDEQGTFLMLLSPKREWQAQETLKKSIVFVLDTSGSMEGERFTQARAALHVFLDSLGPDDRFDVVPFATEPEPFFGARVPVTNERIAEAKARVDKLVAAGGTNIEGALAKALASQEADGRVPIVVFLTDGEPTVGVTVPEEILTSVKRGNAGGSRVFVLGVGVGVNTNLLDRLAQDHGGVRDYVRSGERIDEKSRALFAKLAHPVMSGLELVIDGLTATQVTPARLPDLFAGDRIEVFGRYAAEGAHAIRLRGTVNGAPREYVYEASFPRESTGDTSFVPALWAERRVAALLDAIRLSGPNKELVDEVERLGREYRIVTPYTSHLVVEPCAA
ncbi:MAG: VWA domain-containing protein, partial [Planctomycetota bacterium]